MAAPQLTRNARATRAQLTFELISVAWGPQPGGAAFTAALVNFIETKTNANTRRSFAYSILELFGWLDKTQRRIPTPDRITTGDAANYVRWLETRQTGLRSWYLQQDRSRAGDAMIFQILQRSPGLNLEQIREQLRRAGASQLAAWDKLGHRLACLVSVKTLRRRPSISEIRRGVVDVGLTPAQARGVGITVPVPTGVFRYWAPQDERDAQDRASTMATRLTALSSFWRAMTRVGENLGPARPLLRVDIWGPLLKRLRPRAAAAQKVTRHRKKTSLPLFLRLLAVTYRREYGELAHQMAVSQMFPGRAPEPPRGRTTPALRDVRDRALLLLLGQVGLRAAELQRLRRSSVEGSTLTVRGKGGKKRAVGLPPMTSRALGELHHRLREIARHQQRYGRTDRAAAQLSSEAALIPTLRQWGRNAGTSVVRGLTRAGQAMRLRHLAHGAGVVDGSAEMAMVHPHGLRHLFATVAGEGGTTLPQIQALMGHATGAQTLQYMEETASGKLVAAPFAAPAPAPAAAPVARPAARPAKPDQPPVQPTRVAPPTPRVKPKPKAPPKAPPQAPAPPLEPVRLVVYDAPAPEPTETQLLDAIYAKQWGEQGHRRRLRSAAGEAVETDSRLSALLGGVDVAVVELPADQDLIGNVYVGKESGLAWWTGPSGRLRPAMPVMSPVQVGDCTPSSQDAVCAGIVDLWRRWAGGEGPGPTGATALVLWLRQALRVAGQTGVAISSRGGIWVPSETDWAATADATELVVREHRASAIVGWFEAHAQQYRRGHTRTQNILDEPWSPPAWYGARDPIRELPPRERAEMLDWVAALTGGMPRDLQPQYRSSSRAQVAAFVQSLCAYDAQRDVIGEMKAARRYGEADERSVKAADAAAAAAGRVVERHAREAGMPSYDVVERVAARVTRRKGGEREGRRDFYVRQVADLFGAEAALDPAIALVALCGRTPLADYAKLFAIDWGGSTIQHETAFARTFAQETGAHSECVARRIARDLWEMRKRQAAGATERLLERPDELVDYVQAMRAYRVPCPKSLELELKSRRSDWTPQPVFEAWQAAAEKPAMIGGLVEGQIGAEFGGFQEEFAGAIASEFAGSMFQNNPSRPPTHRYTRRAAHMLPTPIELLVIAAPRL